MSAPTTSAPTSAVAHQHGGESSVPPSDHSLLVTSRDPADFPTPTGREEAWRFTPIRRLDALLSDSEASGSLTRTVTAPSGVVVDDVDTSVNDDAPLPVDRISALAAARAPHTTRISIPAGTTLTEPVVLALHGSSAGDVIWGHLAVEVGSNSSATVVIEHSGTATYGEQLTVTVGDGGSLELVHVQRWDDTAVHSAHVAFSVGRDARVRSLQASVGGGLVRVVETVNYRASGGDVELLGLFFTESGEHVEHRLLVRAQEPEPLIDQSQAGGHS